MIEVAAELGHRDWQIIQSPFLQKKAVTTAFNQRMTIGGGQLAYRQTTLVDIYGRKSFTHTDQNELLALQPD